MIHFKRIKRRKKSNFKSLLLNQDKVDLFGPSSSFGPNIWAKWDALKSNLSNSINGGITASCCVSFYWENGFIFFIIYESYNMIYHRPFNMMYHKLWVWDYLNQENCSQAPQNSNLDCPFPILVASFFVKRTRFERYSSEIACFEPTLHSQKVSW